MPGVDRVSYRSVAGTRLRSSVIGLRVEAPVSATSPSDQRNVALLANARSRGITTFDVGEGAGSQRAERWIRSAFPSVDPDLLVLVHRSPALLAQKGARDRSSPQGGDLETLLRHSLEQSAERLRPHSVGLLLWQPSAEAGAPLGEEVSALERLKTDGMFAGWGLSIPPGGTVSESAAPGEPAPALLSATLSPLDSRLLPPLAERGSHGPLGFFAQDPLGGGRLDGTRFAESVVDRRPDRRPVNVRELHREFAPVLGLGFLTERRNRTLAQASLRFVLRWHWVCSALVPLPSPERLDEIIGTESSPPLSDEEVDRILRLSS